MAKRGRSVSLDKLISELASLDKQRVALHGRIKSAITSALGSWSGENPFPWRKAPGGRRKTSAATAAPKKRRKMSAKARKAISMAQKARWAKQKAGAKKK
jgi:hypothetical protein